jgi:hypothetical protein
MIDGEKNDIEGIAIESYPTILFYSAQKKDEPIKYEGQYLKEEIIKFI